MMRVQGAANVEQYDHRAEESFTVDMRGSGQRQQPQAVAATAEHAAYVRTMTQDFGNMSLGAGEDRDDLDFTSQELDLSGFQVNLQNSNNANNRFSSHEASTDASSMQQTVFQNPDNRPIGGGAARFDAHDERPINANSTGQYDLTSIPLDEIEVEDNYNEVEVATMDATHLDKVKNVYLDILNQSMAPFVKKKTLEVEEEAHMQSGKN